MPRFTRATRIVAAAPTRQATVAAVMAPVARPVPPGARRARSVSPVGRGRGGALRRCYGCGSTEHLVRDCPDAPATAADPHRRLAVMQAIRDEQDAEFADALHAIIAHVPEGERDGFIEAVATDSDETAEATEEAIEDEAGFRQAPETAHD